MEPLTNKRLPATKLFLFVAIFLFISGMLWGLTGALQYVIPGLFREELSFEKVRPLHVSSVVFWILLGAIAAVFTFLQQHTGKKLYSPKLLKFTFYLFSATIAGILITYLLGIFGGREYWEFHPAFAIPIMICWILLLYNFIRSVGCFQKQPVYIWMWTTGFAFFLFTYMESNLWLIPYFRSQIVNDMTIQWKSYGSMVGSWNMLIYGSSIFLMDKISGNKKYSYSKIGFALYFLGLFNMMFNWGHHMYLLPTFSYIKHIGYAVSMTELILLGRIIYLWRASLSTGKKHFHQTSYRFLLAADIWILLTLLLALAMSIPAINIYTHGTHITVAHTMGATIGINSFLLLAFVSDILKDSCRPVKFSKYYVRTYWLTQVCLFVFWLSLITAGVLKSAWQMNGETEAFSSMMKQLHPWFVIFFISGLLLFSGLTALLYPLLKNQWQCFFRPSSIFPKPIEGGRVKPIWAKVFYH